MDTILLWLRKLGILRYGTKKYHYTSGRDMPIEALMDDVIDAEKDIMFDGDKKKKHSKKKSDDETAIRG